MDWLKEAGAVLDFNDGHCFLPLMNGVVLNLPQNQKGHYMLDVVEYLTDGLRNSKGHAAVHVMLEEPDEKPEVINDHSIEFSQFSFLTFLSLRMQALMASSVKPSSTW